MGGRGCGKTRAGAEWVAGRVAGEEAARIALVAPTYNDAREVMLEGESGLLNIGQPSERPSYIASRRRLEWKNGAIGQIFSAEDPDGFKAPGVIVSGASTQANRAHLAPGFIRAMQTAYGGTRIGRQELSGELLLDTPGALWSRAQLEAVQIEAVPPLSRVIVAVDPPVTSGADADACGIIVDADYILAEVNQGGEMVQTILASEHAGIAVRNVRAHISKARRAQPVAVLYEQGRVKHAGRLRAVRASNLRPRA